MRALAPWISGPCAVSREPSRFFFRLIVPTGAGLSLRPHSPVGLVCQVQLSKVRFSFLIVIFSALVPVIFNHTLAFYV